MVGEPNGLGNSLVDRTVTKVDAADIKLQIRLGHHSMDAEWHWTFLTKTEIWKPCNGSKISKNNK